MLWAVKPLCHHMLLTRHPACIVLRFRHGLYAGDGRSPDSRVDASPNLPRRMPSGLCRGRSPPTVAGAVTELMLFGSSAPCSHFISPTQQPLRTIMSS